MYDQETKTAMAWMRENADEIRAHLHDIEDSLDLRRVAAGEIPKHFTTQLLGTLHSKTSVLMTVDQCTSGRFAYMRVRYDDVWRDVIAFEDPADMTMFQLAYDSSNDKFWVDTHDRNYK
jgi:dGTP triphosphohydrolase